jgi:hypothetical protein
MSISGEFEELIYRRSNTSNQIEQDYSFFSSIS